MKSVNRYFEILGYYNDGKSIILRIPLHQINLAVYKCGVKMPNKIDINNFIWQEFNHIPNAYKKLTEKVNDYYEEF